MLSSRALKPAVAVLLAFGLMGVGCKSSDAPRITVLGEDSSNLKAIRTLRTEYESAKNVRLEFNADEFNIANQKANTDLANHTGVYDLILQYNFSLASFSRNRYVLFLGE